MPFKIKVTYGQTTRKFPVSGAAFPSHAQLLAKIRSIFSLAPDTPIALDKVIWAPAHVGQILLATKVEDEPTWRRVTRLEQLRVANGLPDGTMKFTVRLMQPDTTSAAPQTTPSVPTATPTPATPSKQPVRSSASVPATTVVSPIAEAKASLASTLESSKQTLETLRRLPIPPPLPAAAEPLPSHIHSTACAHTHDCLEDEALQEATAPAPLAVIPAADALAAVQTSLAAHHVRLEQGVQAAHAELKSFFSAFLENYAKTSAENVGEHATAAAPVITEVFEKPKPIAADDKHTELKNAIWPAEGGKSNEMVGVWCDACGARVAGIRMKCASRPNYDLCFGCFSGLSSDKYGGTPYDKHLQYTPIFHPDLVKNLKRPDAKAEARPLSLDGQSHAQPPRQPHHQQQQPPSRVVHAASCDFCDSRIVGDRWKCLTCPDWDSCSACKPLISFQHPHHAFVRIARTDDVAFFPPAARTDRYVKPVHDNVVCDHCDDGIVGARFKCVHPACADYDLCERCEALPIAVHPREHPLLKLRVPLDIDHSSYFSASAPVVAVAAETKDKAATATPPVPSPVAKKEDEQEDTGVKIVVLKYLFTLPAVAHDPTLLSALVESLRIDAQELGAVAEVLAWDREEDGVVTVSFARSAPAHAFVSRYSGAAFAGHSVIAMLHDGKTRFRRSSTVAHELAAAVEEVELEMAQRLASPVAPAASAASLALSTSVDKDLISFPDAAAPAEDGRTSLHASFVEDVTVKDGDVFPAGAMFTKAWRLKNNGAAAFHPSTALHFIGGDVFSRVLDVDVGCVQPGEVFAVHVDMQAPDRPGRYLGFWRLRENGEEFGDRVWADIVVSDPAVTSSASSSLGASSIIMPSPPSVRAPPTVTSAASGEAPSSSASTHTHSAISTLSSASSADPDDEDDDDEVSDIESVPESELSAFGELGSSQHALPHAHEREQAEDEFEMVYETQSDDGSTEAE